MARRFAQPLGIHLQDWEGRIIETKKGVVRLLGVHERAKQLFGDAGAAAMAARIEEETRGSRQLAFDFARELGAAAPPEIKGRGRRKRRGAKVSDDDLRAHR